MKGIVNTLVCSFILATFGGFLFGCDSTMNETQAVEECVCNLSELKNTFLKVTTKSPGVDLGGKLDFVVSEYFTLSIDGDVSFNERKLSEFITQTKNDFPGYEEYSIRYVILQKVNCAMDINDCKAGVSKEVRLKNSNERLTELYDKIFSSDSVPDSNEIDNTKRIVPESNKSTTAIEEKSTPKPKLEEVVAKKATLSIAVPRKYVGYDLVSIDGFYLNIASYLVEENITIHNNYQTFYLVGKTDTLCKIRKKIDSDFIELNFTQKMCD